MLCPTHLWGSPNPAPQPHIAPRTSMGRSALQIQPYRSMGRPKSCPTTPHCIPHIYELLRPTDATPHFSILPHRNEWSSEPHNCPTHRWGAPHAAPQPQIPPHTSMGHPKLQVRRHPTDLGLLPPPPPPSPRAAVLPAMRSTLRLKPRPFHFIAPPFPLEGAAASAVQHIPQRCHFRRTALPLPPYWPPYRASTSAVGLPPCVCCTAPPFPPYSTATSGLYSALQNRHFLRTAPPLPPYILLFSTPTSALEIPLSSLDFRCTLPSSPAPSAPSRTTTSAF